MKHKRRMAPVLLLLPMLLAWQPTTPRRLNVEIEKLGELGAIFLSDFATPAQQRGFDLLKAGNKAEAAKLFEEDLNADTTGIAAVGLAQATPPMEWPAQIKQLDDKLNRNQKDVRLAYRLGVLLYYDSIATNPTRAMSDFTEFDRATDLLNDLWKHNRDPLAGLTLTEMAMRFHRNGGPNTRAIFQSLVGIVGGKEAANAYVQAKRVHFVTPPPAVDIVAVDKRHALAGVLCGLWSAAKMVSYVSPLQDAQHPITDPSKFTKVPGDPDQAKEVAYLTHWIQALNPQLGKHAGVPNRP